MTRRRAIEILIQVWGHEESMTAAQHLELEPHYTSEGETPLDALHSIAGIARPDTVAFPPYDPRTSAWYRSLSRVLCEMDIGDARAHKAGGR